MRAPEIARFTVRAVWRAEAVITFFRIIFGTKAPRFVANRPLSTGHILRIIVSYDQCNGKGLWIARQATESKQPQRAQPALLPQPSCGTGLCSIKHRNRPAA